MNAENNEVENFFLSAVEEHKKKNLKNASNLYEKVLKINPNHFESNFKLFIDHFFRKFREKL